MKATNVKDRSGISLSAQAYSSLRERILSGDIRTGRYYLERDLEQLLGFSRTPIREALVRLENEGLIRIQPRHGMQVQPISKADMKEIYQIITALECEAVNTLAQKGLTEQESGVMRAACARMEEALEADDLEGWAAADEDFHRALLDFCGNGRLKQTVLTYWDQAHRARYLTLPFRDKPVNSTKDHQDVLSAISSGDAAKAVEIHEKHRRKGSKVLLDIIERLDQI